VSVRASICPAACNNSAATGWIFIKFHIWIFSKNCRENSSFFKFWQEYRVLYMKTTYIFFNLTFVRPCIIGTMMYATNKMQLTFIDLYWYFFKISCACFGRQTRPSSGARFDCTYSFRYNAPILLLTGDKVEMEHLNLITGRQQYRCIVPKAVCTVKTCSWRWTSLSLETCRTDF